MLSARYCPSCLSAVASTSSPARSRHIYAQFVPFLEKTQLRYASSISDKTKREKAAARKKRKAKSTFDTPDLKDMLQFPLVDAMRYLRAAEVGYPPAQSKYEVHVRLKTQKNGAVVRNRLRLPHPVKTDLRICAICPPNSPMAAQAKAAGASIVGEDEVFKAVKEGNIDFERCVCHVDSAQALNKSGIARMLGPRGLMPSAKLGTVVKDVGATIRDMAGGVEYRERMGCVRLAVGQLGFTPEQVAENIRAFMESVKRDIGQVAERTPKEIHEVVLSSTIGPGMSLTGDFTGGSVSTQSLARAS